MSLPSRVLEHCRQRLAMPPGVRVAVAVSGGLDSVVLLEVLLRLRAALGIELAVATVDHGLRGRASADDAAFVRRLARERGLPCYGARFEGFSGRGLEDAARRERHAFLRSVPAGRIALGHHRDDQAETVLLRILRSADPGGLRGMRPAEGRLVRPLLEEPRAALHAWALAEGLTWREDTTNEDPARERNQLRRVVLPVLEGVHGGAARRLAQLARLLGEEDADTDPALALAVARGWLDLELLQSRTGEAAKGRLLRAFVAGITGRHDGLGHEACARVSALAERGADGWRITLAGGGCLALVRGGLCCLPPPPLPLALRLPGVRRWGVYDLQVERAGQDREALFLRGPLPGERFGGQALREWLRRRGVPAALRPYHPVFCRTQRPVWIPPGLPDARDRSLGLAIRLTASIAIGDEAGRAWSTEL